MINSGLRLRISGVCLLIFVIIAGVVCFDVGAAQGYDPIADVKSVVCLYI